MDSTENPFSDQSHSIFDNPDVLGEEYTPERILEREDEIDEYVMSLTPAIDNNDPDNMMVYGPTGVGKTAVTRFSLRKLNEMCEDADVNLEIVWQNCNYESVYNCFTNLVNTIRPPDEQIPESGIGTDDVMEAMYESFEELGDVVILVLDEIDHLDDIDSTLYDLTRARSIGHLDTAKLGLIGISNNYKFRDVLSQKTKDTLQENEIDFAPYDATQLTTILQDRVTDAFQDDVISEAELRYCAAQTAKDTGNARQALDILKIAGKLARKKNADSITNDHIEEARLRVERGEIKNKIDQLTHQERLLLETVSRLEAHGGTPARSKEVFAVYQKIAVPHTIDPLSTVRTVRENLSELAMKGFLYSRRENKGRAGGVYNLYECDMQPSTVVETLGRLQDYMVYDRDWNELISSLP